MRSQFATCNQVRSENVNNQRVVSIGMTVKNLKRSIAFYCDVLGFELGRVEELSGPEFEELIGISQACVKTARLWLGAEVLELTEFLSPRGRAMPADSRSNDLWFQHIAIVVSDIDAAYAQLVRRDVEHVSLAPQRLPAWNLSAAGIQAFYFRDPDGHFLELLQFPPDKGDSKWHQPTHQLFLGIDHTAIVVKSSEKSLQFYCDKLGLRVDGRGENYGLEQEQLNNVPYAKVKITGLRAATGPGIELLEYLSPMNGRPRPMDSLPNDLLHWQTTIYIDGQDARLIVDPDGHVVQLVS